MARHMPHKSSVPFIALLGLLCLAAGALGDKACCKEKAEKKAAAEAAKLVPEFIADPADAMIKDPTALTAPPGWDEDDAQAQKGTQEGVGPGRRACPKKRPRGPV